MCASSHNWSLAWEPVVSKKIILHGRLVVAGVAEGEALVTKHTISGFGGIDSKTVIITEVRHELRGQSFKDLECCDLSDLRAYSADATSHRIRAQRQLSRGV